MKTHRLVMLAMVIVCTAAFAVGFTSAAVAAAAVDCDAACDADCGAEYCEDVSYIGCGCAWWCTNGEKGQILCGA